MEDKANSKANIRFPDYVFTEMATDDEDSFGKKCNKKKVVTPRKIEKVRRCLSDNLLLLVTVAGVLFGVVLGFILRPLELSSDAVMLVSYPGELFMRLLKMLILPLIVASIITGSTRLNASTNGKIAIRTLVYFFLTSLTNAILGTILALSIHPGDPRKKVDLREETVGREVHILDGILDLGRNIITDNIFQAAFQQAHTVYTPKHVVVQNVTDNDTSALLNASESIATEVEIVRTIEYRPGTNTLGIIFFSLIFGTMLGTMGRRANVVVQFFAIIDEVVMRLVSRVMWLTPIGVSSVICGKILSVEDLGLVMQQLGWFVFTVTLGVFIYQLVIMQLIYFVIIHRNPFKFYWGLVPATMTAFATASTAAALPVTFRCMDEKVRVDPRISRFILPVGCSINMDGTALFVAVASIFITQLNELQLSVGEIITICLASTAASFSSASVPSAALVLIFMVLSTINAPSQDVFLLFAVDWFVDRIRTTNNMLGDCYAAAIVEHLSKEQLAAAGAAIHQEDQMAPSSNYLLPMHYTASSEPTEPQAVVAEMLPNVVTNGAVKKL